MADDALPIVRGFAYGLRMTVTGDQPVFPSGASFRAQVRNYQHSASPLADLTTANGGIVRVSDDTVDIFIEPEATAQSRNTTAVLDLVRTDTTPEQYLYVLLQIPVFKPVTEGS